MKKTIIGILNEWKVPTDTRTPLIPEHAALLRTHYPGIEVYVQPSDKRTFKNDDYQKFEVELTNSLNHCNLLLGVKEVPPEKLIAEKTYMFFSHTIKGQAENREMLKAIMEKKIRLIDYELLTDNKGQRLIGFGRLAGVVGAHYSIIMLGKRKEAYNLSPAHQMENEVELFRSYKQIDIPPSKFIVTGSGRVANGAIEVLEAAGVRCVTKEDFLNRKFHVPVYVQLFSSDLFQHKYHFGYERQDFHKNPENYYSIFHPFTRVADVLINAIYWDPKAPRLFEREDARKSDFKIKCIADVTCDKDGSIPLTLKYTSSADPYFGYNPVTDSTDLPFEPVTVDIMAINNLPNELPKDASRNFSEVLSSKILPRFHLNPNDEMFTRATITQNGELTEDFKYLEKFIAEERKEESL